MSNSEKIERYIYGEMSQEEKIEFEIEIQQNPDLANEIALSKKIDLVLGDKPFLDLFKSLEEIKQSRSNSSDTEAPVKPLAKNNRFYYLVAASIAILCIVGAILIYNNTKTSSEFSTDLFAVNYIPKSISRSEKTQGDSISNTAFYLFAERKYLKAIPLFNQLLATDSTNMEIWLCKGISLYEEKSFADAILVFDKILKNAPNIFVEQAEWILALSYYKNNQKEKSRALFKKISASSSSYHEKASEALKMDF